MSQLPFVIAPHRNTSRVAAPTRYRFLPPGQTASQWFARPKLFLPRWYSWFAVAGIMDLVCTYVVLTVGGQEMNPVADAILSWGGFEAMIAFKLLMMGLIVMACQYIHEHKPKVARRLAVASTLITFFAPLWGSYLLYQHLQAY